MKSLPDNVKAYKRTATFDESSLPVALRQNHSTKTGVWGLIHVEAGRLIYEIATTGEVIELSPGAPPGVVEPEVPHKVSPVGEVRCFVEFYR